jgi:hypothetical protein
MLGREVQNWNTDIIERHTIGMHRCFSYQTSGNRFSCPICRASARVPSCQKTSLARERDNSIYHIDEKIPKAQEQSAEKYLFSQLESLNDFIYLVNGIYSRSEAVSRVAF